MRGAALRVDDDIAALALCGAAPRRSDCPAVDGPHHRRSRWSPRALTPAAGGDVTLALECARAGLARLLAESRATRAFRRKLDWTLPKGVTAGEPAYPVPGTLLIAGLMNYVYEAPYAPLVTLEVPAGLARGDDAADQAPSSTISSARRDLRARERDSRARR